MSEPKNISFIGHLAGFRTDGRTGAFKVTLDIFQSETEAVKALPDFYLKNVQVAIVLLPENP